MKKFSFVILSVVLLGIIAMIPFAGCNAPNLPEPTQGKIVKVERITSSLLGQSQGIQLSCDSAEVDTDGRRVILEGVKQFGSYGGRNWIGYISIEGNNLVLEFPPDADYWILIGKKDYILPRLEDDE